MEYRFVFLFFLLAFFPLPLCRDSFFYFRSRKCSYATERITRARVWRFNGTFQSIVYRRYGFRRHRCPHNLPQENLDFSHEDGPVDTVTSYRQDYDVKRVEKQTKYHHEDHLRTEGEFIGERRTDYVATRGERAAVKKPQDHLKPEGEFVGRPKEEAPTRGERAPVKRPQDNLKFEGEFDGESR